MLVLSAAEFGALTIDERMRYLASALADLRQKLEETQNAVYMSHVPPEDSGYLDAGRVYQ